MTFECQTFHARKVSCCSLDLRTDFNSIEKFGFVPIKKRWTLESEYDSNRNDRLNQKYRLYPCLLVVNEQLQSM
jgi:hypothetical protein